MKLPYIKYTEEMVKITIQKLPFNWAGNKYYYMSYVNALLHRREYNRVIDLFMGSGNMLMNTNVKANEFIGTDILKLMPMVLNFMRDNPEEYTLEEIKKIENKWGFTSSENYYEFRDYWNSKYVNNLVDKQFIYETVMLLKMCNNSLVRFNRKGEFNQGFRGIGKNNKIGKFFTENILESIPKELNAINKKLHLRTHQFYNKDYKELLQNDIRLEKKDLLLLDPPYILTNTCAYGGTYDNEDETKLMKLIENIESDFILFNYIYNVDTEHSELVELIERKDYKVITLRTKGKLKTINNNSPIHEVLITNIKGD